MHRFFKMNPSSQPTRKELRNFGLMFGVIFTGIGLYQLYNDTAETARLVWWGFGGLFFITGLAVPPVLKPIFTVWMKFAFVLGWVNTRIIITLIFFLVITPIGLVMRVWKSDLLAEKWDKDAETYWHKIERLQSLKEHFERQF